MLLNITRTKNNKQQLLKTYLKRSWFSNLLVSVASIICSFTNKQTVPFPDKEENVFYYIPTKFEAGLQESVDDWLVCVKNDYGVKYLHSFWQTSRKLRVHDQLPEVFFL